jgi:RNA polymerase sigma-70 factor, ECF subfamily
VRIVINRALEKVRKRRQRGAEIPLDNVVDLDAHIDTAGGPLRMEKPEDGAERAELRRLLERRIDALPAPYRTVFVLRAVEELSVEESAACLGIPQATVRTRFFRARSLLREAMARDLDVAIEDAFGFDGARCDRIVAAVLEHLARAAMRS